jgi:bacterioferritin-associated ferredoxin
MYVCICKAVTDGQIKRAICDGKQSRRDLHKCLGVGGDCGKCVHQVKEILNDHKNQQLLIQNSSTSILAA